MKRHVRVLMNKAVDSVVLAVDHFNGVSDRGRPEAVLILLDRGFELLLKAAILHKGGRIRPPRAQQTIGFDQCVRKCVSDEQVKCLTEEDALNVQMINNLRDAAQHHIIDISEQELYVFAQAGLTLFSKLLQEVFSTELGEYVPHRVLPVSTEPPKEFLSIVKMKFEEVKALVAPGARKRLRARARLRSLAVIEAALEGRRSQPTEVELGRLIGRIRNGETCGQIFPGVCQLQLDSTGGAMTLTLRLSKKEGEPVRQVPEGTPGATVVAVRRVSELGFYNLGLFQVAEKVGLTAPKVLAVIKHLGLQQDVEYFKEFRIGAARYKRYSQKVVAKLREEIANLDIQEVWEKHRPRPRYRAF